MFTSQTHSAPPPPPGLASPLITSPSRSSARQRTLSVLRSVTHRVATAAATTSQSPPPPSASTTNSASSVPAPAASTTTTTTTSASHDSAEPTSPSPGGHSSPRSIWPHSPIRRSLSYTPAVASQGSPAGARDSVSEESIVRSKSHGPGPSVLGPSLVTAVPTPTSVPLSAAGGPSSSSAMSREQDGAAAAAAVAQLSPGPMVESPLQSPLIDIPRPAGGPSPSSSPELPLGSASDAMQASLGPAAPGGGAAAATSTAPAPPTSHPHNPAATLPSIRFTAYLDPRAARPSLTFSNTTRILPSGTEVIRVGRYSERDGHGTASSSDRIPNASPVGFKSKVVSRRHCEFWFENSKWYIKDVKSSSGTFLNHIRLSPPNTESKPYAVSDGDIVQLGIDFKGGEEMIFRCVKIRLELNRGWASRPSNFNLASHKRLRSLVSPGSSNSQDCSICLNSIAPCQSLFVAPCSHTWHYKCIRSLLNTPQYPYFQCPNCRASADLEAEVEETDEDWERLSAVQEATPDGDSEGKGKETELPLPPPPPPVGAAAAVVGTTGTVINQSDDASPGQSGLFSPSPQMPADAPAEAPSQMLADVDPPSASRVPLPLASSAVSSVSMSVSARIDGAGGVLPAREWPRGDSAPPSTYSPAAAAAATSTSAAFAVPAPAPAPVPVPLSPSSPAAAGAAAASPPPVSPGVGFHRQGGQRTPSPGGNPGLNGADGPITPRNDAGPWVFDGSAGRRATQLGGLADTVAGTAGRDPAASAGTIDGIMDTDDDDDR